jgi:large subunit ribosomal protein L24
MAARIRKGDTVVVIAGKNRGGRPGVVKEVRGDRVTVEGVNVVKKHQKPTPTNRGGIIEREAPIHISNVMLVQGGQPTRVGFRTVDGRKVRFGRKKGEAIDG